jgi:hypothetical protein
MGRTVVEKNGSQKPSPSPSPRIGRVEIGKERGPKTDIDKENTPSVPPAELPEDNDDMVTDVHTVYTAPEAPEKGTDPIVTPPPLDDDPISDDTLTGRESTDTITLETLTESTLDIGIPCIISSKRKRFRAFARYIGEVLGESGPWVGDLTDGRAWCDGSWGGIRYFDIGASGSEWEFGVSDDARAPRRRKAEWGAMSFKGAGGTKREGDQLQVSFDRMKRMRSASPVASDMSASESMGLFVRPQQVLYVVDAVGADL